MKYMFIANAPIVIDESERSDVNPKIWKIQMAMDAAEVYADFNNPTDDNEYNCAEYEYNTGNGIVHVLIYRDEDYATILEAEFEREGCEKLSIGSFLFEKDRVLVIKNIFDIIDELQ